MSNQTTSVENDYGLAHNVDIRKIVLTNHAGQSVDIRNLFVQMNIRNSIFESCIYGDILIIDSNALVSRFPIIGEEKIEIEFLTPGNTAKSFTGVVYRVADLASDTKGSSSSYVIKFCSEELYANFSTFVAKSYRNTLTAEQIVEDILKSYLNVDKKLDIDPCIDPQKVLCIPYMRPYDAIEFMSDRVRSRDTEEDYFLFFERFDGIYFKNLAGIVSSPLNKEEVFYYYISDKFGNQRDQALDIRRIVNLKINSVFDTLTKLKEGMLNNEQFEYSFDDKYVYSNVTSYKDVRPFIGNERMNTPEFIEKYARADAMGLSGNITSFTERRVDQNFNFVKPAGKSLINKLALSQISLTITVPGDSAVDVGDIITIKVPEFDADAETVTDDPMLSGRYIIGSITNTFITPDKHTMHLDIYKDGFSNKIKAMDSKLKDDLQ